MIEVKNLTKRYGNIHAIKDLNFTVDKGEVLGFLGPNGAGKTTTMNILTGYISASEGYAKIGEYDILENPMEAKKMIGYLPEQPPLYVDMTVKEYLEFMYDLKKVAFKRIDHISTICEQVKITHVYNRVIKNLSKGYRQRVGLAQALLGNPDVLILDEPTVGLDPGQIIEIRNLIYDLGKQHTILFSSHILSEVQAVCERVIVINRGEIVANGTPNELSQKLSTSHDIIVRVEGPEDVVYNTLSKVHGVEKVDRFGRKENNAYEFNLVPKEDVDIRRAVFTRLAEKKFPILSMTSSELSLEDIFLKLVAGMQVSDDLIIGKSSDVDTDTDADTDTDTASESSAAADADTVAEEQAGGGALDEFTEEEESSDEGKQSAKAKKRGKKQ